MTVENQQKNNGHVCRHPQQSCEGCWAAISRRKLRCPLLDLSARLIWLLLSVSVIYRVYIFDITLQPCVLRFLSFVRFFGSSVVFFNWILPHFFFTFARSRSRCWLLVCFVGLVVVLVLGKASIIGVGVGQGTAVGVGLLGVGVGVVRVSSPVILDSFWRGTGWLRCVVMS